jgi:hypothetical protein
MDLEIDEECNCFDVYSPYQCQHEIKLGDKKETWSGTQICQYYIDYSWPIPDHFKKHMAQCKKKCDNLEFKYGKYYPFSIRQKLEFHFPPGSLPLKFDTSDPMYIVQILQ